MVRRIPVMTRDQVAEEHTAAYDEIASIRGRPPVMGPSSLGYFRLLALNANAFTIDLPDQRTEPLLPI
jgi:hypothetical protein